MKRSIASGSGVAAIAATSVAGIASTSVAVVSASSKKTALNTPSGTGQKPKKTR